MARRPSVRAGTPNRSGTPRPTGSTEDAFAWWEDKQVAVMVNGDLVRGWVLTCRHVADPAAHTAAGQMTIVLLISDPVMTATYPDTVIVDVTDDGGRGRPRRVRGLWAEEDLADVHSRRPIAASPSAVTDPQKRVQARLELGPKT